MKRAINVLENWERDVMLAAKFGQTVVITEPTFDDLMDEAWDQFEDEEQMVEEEFCKNARDNFSRKNRRAQRRKHEFKNRAKKQNAAKYYRSGLVVADSNAVHSRVGDTYNMKQYKRIRKDELMKLVDVSTRDEEFLLNDYGYDDMYEEWLAWQDYNHDYDDYDYDDYGCDDYDDYDYDLFEEVSDIEVSLTAKYEEGYEKGYKAGQLFGYNEGYDAGYIAAMKDLGRA